MDSQEDRQVTRSEKAFYAATPEAACEAIADGVGAVEGGKCAPQVTEVTRKRPLARPLAVQSSPVGRVRAPRPR